MNEFMFLFRGGDHPNNQLSPEEIQTHMAKWGAWMGSLGEQGRFVAGQPLKAETGKVVHQSGGMITDGPFTEGKEIVGGYLIVKANDLTEATEMSKACPIFEREGSTVEIREIMSMSVEA